ncbi:hypothetical protein LP419_15090 [Massilia sp. H-1]|nr:hypothetical protein LP419_15090 [Massilia sp. H-1]
MIWNGITDHAKHAPGARRRRLRRLARRRAGGPDRHGRDGVRGSGAGGRVCLGVGVVLIGALFLAALVAAIAISPLLLPILIPCLIVWFIARRSPARQAPDPKESAA